MPHRGGEPGMAAGGVELAQEMDGIVLLVVVLAVATAAGLVWRQRSGRVRTGRPAPVDPTVLASLGVRPGSVTVLQFSSVWCQPCRATRAMLEDLVADHAGLANVEVDVEAHPGAVRELNVRRTPTVFVLDRSGRIAGRASGAPSRADIDDALRPLLELA